MPQDMDLLNDSRSLIHSGKLYRQPDGGVAIGRGDWTELFVILFDNYRMFQSSLFELLLILCSCDDEA